MPFNVALPCADHKKSNANYWYHRQLYRRYTLYWNIPYICIPTIWILKTWLWYIIFLEVEYDRSICMFGPKRSSYPKNQFPAHLSFKTHYYKKKYKGSVIIFPFAGPLYFLVILFYVASTHTYNHLENAHQLIFIQSNWCCLCIHLHFDKMDVPKYKFLSIE